MDEFHYVGKKSGQPSIVRPFSHTNSIFKVFPSAAASRCSVLIEGGGEEDLERLRQFDDGVYFHQTSILHREGAMLFPDLPNALAYGRDYAEEIRDSQWRIHYHIPLYASPEPPLKSTEEFILKTHNFLRGRKGPQPHLEVETYTWSVLPDHMKIPLAAQIARELHYIETL